MQQTKENEPILFSQPIEEDLLKALPKHKLERLRKMISDIHKAKYRRSYKRKPKYGNLHRGFTEKEIKKFFKAINKKWEYKYYTIFKLMSYLGLRIGEVVKLKLENIHWQEKKLTLVTEKSQLPGELYLHKKAYTILKQWVEKNYIEIRNHNDFLFFSDYKFPWAKKHLAVAIVEKKFEQIRKKAGLAEPYGKASDENNPTLRRNRNLYALTSHSFRHYFITQTWKRLAQAGKLNPREVQKASRLEKMESLMVYVTATQDEVDQAVKLAWELNNAIPNLETRLEEIKLSKKP